MPAALQENYMLSRYSAPEMVQLWSDAARYDRWRLVELAVLDAKAERGLVPDDVVAQARAVATPQEEDVIAEEQRVGHDVVAFLNAWTSTMPDEVASHVHRGLTSSDTVDTAQAIAVGQAAELVDAAVDELVFTLCDRALEFRNVVCVARTHGQPAALTVVGQRFADFAFAVDRARERLRISSEAVGVIKLSGPVGVGAGLPREFVQGVAIHLGLRVPPVTTQVVFRDSIAAWVSDLALLGAVCESVATDLRLGQHDGVRELAEVRSDEQVGSSAMPHKRNPVGAENVTGLARVLRGYVGPVLENVALWQHRDISHSAVERVVLPDASSLALAVARRTARLVEGLRVDEEQVAANIDRAGAQLVSASRLCELMAQGMTRAAAAAQVRSELATSAGSTFDVAKARDAVLDSSQLARTFELVVDLRAT